MSQDRNYTQKGRSNTNYYSHREERIKEFHTLYFEKKQKDRALKKLRGITPEYLYRYRPVHRKDSEATGFDDLISMIENKNFYVWFTNPHKFNDPYDSFISPDITPVYNQFKQLAEISPKVIENIYHILRYIPFPASKEEQDKEMFKAIKMAIFDPPKEIDTLLSPEETEMCKTYSDYNLKNLLSSSNQITSDSISEQMGVVCFSEEKRSLLMWSHYAENHSGYCLEYRTDDIKKVFHESIYGLFPIRYTFKFDALMGDYVDYYLNHETVRDELLKLTTTISQKIGKTNDWESLLAKMCTPDVLPLLNEFIFSCNSKLLQNEDLVNHFLKRSCKKASDWKYEKEWRIITRLPANANTEEKQLSLTPTCIYLGAKSSDKEEKRVIRAINSSGLNIPVKKMRMRIDVMRLYEDACF